MAIAVSWTRAFWGVGLALVAVWPFWDAVVASIEATPHPAIVYTIFACIVAAVFLLGLTLNAYLGEEALLRRLQGSADPERQAILASPRLASPLLPLYRHACAQGTVMSLSADQTALEHEMSAGLEALAARLTLPGYIAGALVGLGLIGTFIGLLGTLQDLAKIFSSMQELGSANANPVELFGGMVKQLQEPMRGMGTAFVASLYGLLGSLLVGLSQQSVRSRLSILAPAVREFVTAQRARTREAVALPVASHGSGGAGPTDLAPLLGALQALGSLESIDQRLQPLGSLQQDLATLRDALALPLAAIARSLEAMATTGEQLAARLGHMDDRAMRTSDAIDRIESRLGLLVGHVEVQTGLISEGMKLGLATGQAIGPALRDAIAGIESRLAEQSSVATQQHADLVRQLEQAASEASARHEAPTAGEAEVIRALGLIGERVGPLAGLGEDLALARDAATREAVELKQLVAATAERQRTATDLVAASLLDAVSQLTAIQRLEAAAAEQTLILKESLSHAQRTEAEVRRSVEGLRDEVSGRLGRFERNLRSAVRKLKEMGEGVAPRPEIATGLLLGLGILAGLALFARLAGLI